MTPQNPLTDATTARHFIETRARRHVIERIPMDRLHVLCAATVDGFGESTIDVAGIGENEGQAVLAAAGEAIETLSQLLRPDDLTARASDAPPWRIDPESWLSVLMGRPGDRQVTARTLFTEEAVSLPATIIFRMREQAASAMPPLSEGCAAGKTLEDAQLGAVLELVERDAVARWWRGGRPARLVERGFVERRGGGLRRICLLDLSGGALAPVAGLVSSDPEGRGFVFAAAARMSFSEARAAATRELAQFEVGMAVTGKAQIETPSVDSLIGPLVEDDRDVPDRHRGRTTDHLAELADRSQSAGIDFAWIDLTRPDIGAPVVKAVSPGLEPSRPVTVSPRILAERSAFGQPPPAREGQTPY